MDDLEVVGAAEAREILGVELQRISRWRKQGKLPPPYSPLAMSPVWLQRDIEAFKRGETDFTEPPDPTPILGTAEAAMLLEVDKSQVGRWRKRPPRHGPAFPEPWRQVKAGPIWKREQIEQFADLKAYSKRSRNGAAHEQTSGTSDPASEGTATESSAA